MVKQFPPYTMTFHPLWHSSKDVQCSGYLYHLYWIHKVLRMAYSEVGVPILSVCVVCSTLNTNDRRPTADIFLYEWEKRPFVTPLNPIEWSDQRQNKVFLCVAPSPAKLPHPGRYTTPFVFPSYNKSLIYFNNDFLTINGLLLSRLEVYYFATERMSIYRHPGWYVQAVNHCVVIAATA